MTNEYTYKIEIENRDKLFWEEKAKTVELELDL